MYNQLLDRQSNLYLKKLKKLNKPDYLFNRLLETYRTTTGSVRLLPQFLIIGTQKGGTTSLYRYLEQHPCIAPAFTKEVHYFDNHTRDYKYGKGISWYRSHFAYSSLKYYHQFFLRQSLITGEATPDYLFDLHAPKRILSDLPNLKFIVMLRNPVDRAYSHYLHNCRAVWDKGREPLSFESAIAEESIRISDEIDKINCNEKYFSYNYMHYSYVSRGVYVEQLKRWFVLFPQHQFLILKSEDFFDNPRIIYDKVLDFLGLEPWHPTEFKAFNTRTREDQMMPSSTKAYLDSYFRPYNQKLYQLLNMNFEW